MVLSYHIETNQLDCNCSSNQVTGFYDANIDLKWVDPFHTSDLYTLWKHQKTRGLMFFTNLFLYPPKTSENLTFLTLWYAHVCACQGVKMLSFLFSGGIETDKWHEMG